LAKDDGKNNHRGQRLDDRPGGTQNGLLVAYLDVSPSKEIKKFSILPEVVEFKRNPTTAWPNNDCGDYRLRISDFGVWSYHWVNYKIKGERSKGN